MPSSREAQHKYLVLIKSECAVVVERPSPDLVFNEDIIEYDSLSTLQIISVKYRSVHRSDTCVLHLETLTV